MTIIDVLAALQEGSLPTNVQLTRAIQVLLETPALQTQLLSPTAGQLITDVRTLLETSAELVQKRNGGEEAQTFLWRSRGVANEVTEVKGRMGKSDKLNSKGKGEIRQRTVKAVAMIKDDAQQAYKHLRTLARLLLVQPELRHLLSDLGLLAAEVLDRTAVHTLTDARITLGQVRSTTGTFQNLVGRAWPTTSKQNSSAVSEEAICNLDSTQGVMVDLAKGAQQGMPVLAELNMQLKETVTNGLPPMQVLDEELGNAEAVPELRELKARVEAGHVGTLAEPLTEAKESIITSQTSTLAPAVAEDLVPTDLLDAAQMAAVAQPGAHLVDQRKVAHILKQTGSDAKQNVKDSWTEERQENLKRRLRKLAVDCQRNEDYREAVLWLIGRVEILGKTAQENLASPAASLDKALDEATEPLIQLFENFADGRSLRSILELARELSIGTKTEPALVALWSDAGTLFRKSLLQEAYALESECEQAWREIAKRFDGVNAQYKQDLIRLVNEATDFTRALANDKLLQRFAATTASLLRDISIGSGGNFTPTKELWQDLRVTILPAIFEKVGVLPVPRVKYLHPDFDLVVENIALELKHLLPSLLGIRMVNDLDFEFEKGQYSSHSHSLKIKIKGMSLRVHKLAFALTLRTGLGFHDRGIADVLVGGFGLTIHIDVPKEPGQHYFFVRTVKAKLKTLKIQVHRSNHRILHTFAKVVANSYVTKRIFRHFIAMGITTGLEHLNLALVSARFNKDQDAGKLDMDEVRRRMAELRDLMRKYNEQAGTLEIDFKRDEIPENVKGWEDGHAVKWLQGQLLDTGKDKVVRNEWRSTAFDKVGEETIVAPSTKVSPHDSKGETVAEAKRKGKLGRPSTDTSVNRAERTLEQAEAEAGSERRQAKAPQGMKSAINKEAVEHKRSFFRNKGSANEKAKKFAKAIDAIDVAPSNV